METKKNKVRREGQVPVLSQMSQERAAIVAVGSPLSSLGTVRRVL